MKELKTPFTKEKLAEFEAGESVLLSGTIYTARDAAHKRMLDNLDQGIDIPFDIEDSAIYYCGPSPAKPGEVIGSAGPTTSYRMDSYAPRLMDLGMSVMIGKGPRNQAVVDGMKKNGVLYLAAVGGAGALISQCIKSSELIDYEDLGPEAIRKLEVENLPLIVAIDTRGKSMFDR